MLCNKHSTLGVHNHNQATMSVHLRHTPVLPKGSPPALLPTAKGSGPPRSPPLLPPRPPPALKGSEAKGSTPEQGGGQAHHPSVSALQARDRSRPPQRLQNTPIGRSLSMIEACGGSQPSRLLFANTKLTAKGVVCLEQPAAERAKPSRGKRVLLRGEEEVGGGGGGGDKGRRVEGGEGACNAPGQKRLAGARDWDHRDL